jgi:hypothetical protein
MYPDPVQASRRWMTVRGAGLRRLRRGEAGVAADTHIMPPLDTPRIGKNADMAMPVWVGDLTLGLFGRSGSR